MKLIIVESPHKAKTISHIMGADYTVKASVGHIRDLAKDEISIDLKTFVPKYSFIDAKKQAIVKELKAIADRSSEVIIASDPDREGEAIAWHLKESLHLKKYRRAEFHEITVKGIKNGLDQTKQIDMNLVTAQEARRVIDRLIGYGISPKLSRAVSGAKSAGRVQTAALRLILRRESEHMGFRPRAKFAVDCEIDQEGIKFKATVIKKTDDEKVNIDELDSEDEANSIKKELDTVTEGQVIDIEHKSIKKNAPAPFTTSTYQQAVNNMLNISSDDAMKIAQKLYEGGYITYMRTDSVRLSSEAELMAKNYIADKYGEKYSARNTYKNRDCSQDAHEAIRPADINKKINNLGQDEIAIYNIITKRFLASQMSSAIYNQINVYVQISSYILKSAGSKLSFNGYHAVYADADKDSNISLSDINKGHVGIISVRVRDWLTKPRPRYTEASLIKELESKGIGRPSTYASIIKTLKNRQYVKITSKKILPTETADRAMRWLVNEFNDFFDINYSATMEKRLDKIAEGKDTYQAVIGDNISQLKAHNIDFVNSYKPSDKQISFAEKLAKDKGTDLPEGYKNDYKICKKYITKTLKKK